MANPTAGGIGTSNRTGFIIHHNNIYIYISLADIYIHKYIYPLVTAKSMPNHPPVAPWLDEELNVCLPGIALAINGINVPVYIPIMPLQST